MLDRVEPRRLGAVLFMAAVMLVLAGCTESSGSSPLPKGQAAYSTIPEKADNGEQSEKMRAGDRLSIKIFGEPELSSDNYRVDAIGFLQMPLVGELIAGGQSPRELGAEITRRLAAKYVRDPQVAVSIIDRPRSTFTVEGDVESPGVFEANPETTLLTGLAQAKSPKRTAKLDEVAVFRSINGQRAGALFNLTDIRRGRAADPQILAGDKIVVGKSSAKQAWRDFLEAAPVFNAFRFY